MKRTSEIVLTATLVCLLLATTSRGIAQDQSPRYRRIAIPQDSVEQFVGGLRPVSRAEFESLVSPPSDVAGSTFSSARYQAVFDGDQLTNGTGTIYVDPSSRGTGQFLTLGGSLAIANARWIRGEAFQSATIGRHDQQTVVLADVDSNQLEVEWSCRPLPADRKATLMGDRSFFFDVSFPDAFAQELLIETPEKFEVIASNALVEMTATKVNGNAVWSIRWSGRSNLSFRLSTAANRTDTRVDIESNYLIKASDIRLELELHLTRFASARVLELAVDPGLSVNSIRSDSQELLFAKSETEDDVILVELPNRSGLSSEDKMLIEVDAIGKLVLMELRALPRIRPRVQWGSEAIRCRVAPMLTMLDLQLERCVCSSLIRNLEVGYEEYLFELKTKAAEVKFVLGGASADFLSESIVAIQMLANLVEAKAEIRFQPWAGELFDLQIDFDVDEGWELLSDSVEVLTDVDGLPRSVLGEQPKISAGQLNLHLDQAATFDQPVHVRMELRNSLGKATSADQLMPIQVHGTLDRQSWMYIENTPGLELTTTGAEHGKWQRSDESEQLPVWIESWIESVAGIPQADDIFLRHNLDAKLVGVRRMPVPTLPEVRSSTRLEFSADELRYTLDVQVDPQGKDMDRLAVKFSRPLDIGGWSFTDRSKKPIVEGTGDVPDLLHEIRFDATSEPYQLHFEKVLKLPLENSLTTNGDTSGIPLATFENTTDGNGSVSIVVDGAINLEIQPGEGLDAVPFSVLSTHLEEERYFRGAFRYDDTSTKAPTLHVACEKQPASSGSWIWRSDLRSFYAEKGRPRHRADYFIQSEGATELRLELSARYALETVEVDGVPLDPTPRMSESTDGLELLIPLPRDNRFPCVSVKYVEVDRSLRAIDRLFPSLPISDLPSMQETWQVWLPKDYRVYDPTQENASWGSWLSRITGYVGSPSAEEFETSVFRSLGRRWVPSVGDAVGVIQQIEVLIGSDWPFEEMVADNGRLPWGERLMLIASTIGRSRTDFELLIDREELRRIGIFADTLLPEAIAEAPRLVGGDRLSQSGLVLVVEGRRALVTSMAAARRHTSKIDWIDEVSVDGEIHRFGESRLLPVEEWATDELAALWRPTQDDLEIGLQQAGWAPDRRNLAADKTPLKIYHRDTIVAVSCAILCLGFALGWWMFGHGRRVGFMACAVAMAASLWLPQPGATLACAFAWALVASAVLRLVRKRRSQQKLREPVIRRLTPTRAAIWFFVATGFVANAHDADAQDADTQVESSTKAQTEEVFVYFPTDDVGELTSMVYLPSAFYRNLKRLDAEREEQVDLLLSKADYVGTWPADQSPLRLRAKYLLTTFVKDATFELPDYGPLVQIDLKSVRLNRQPVTPDEIGERFSIRLPGVGDYRVSFEIQKPVSQRINGERFDISIPIAPEAALELKVPRGTPQIEILASNGRVEFDSQNSILLASLGHSSRLTIVARKPGSKSNPLPQIEQNMRIELGEDKSDVYVRFDFADDEFPLFLDVDPRLTFVDDSSWEWDPDTATFNNAIGPTATLHFEISSPVDRFEIPEMKPLNAEIAKSRIAISSGSQANLRIDGGAAVALPLDSFSEIWSETLELPELYFEVASELPSVEVGDILRTEKWTSELSYFFDPLTTRVEVKAQLIPEYEQALQTTVRRLRIPALLEIHELSATSTNGVPKRIRWRRYGEEVVLFFLDRIDASATSPLEINIQGNLTTGNRDSVALPVVELISNQSDTAVMRNVVNIYRAADVSVHMEEPGPFVRDAIDVDSKLRDGYRLHGTWSSETVGFQPAPDALTVTRQVLKRKIRGSVTTRLINDNFWWADIIVQLECDDGVDVVYLDVPSSLCFKQPEAFEGDVKLRVDTVRGGPRIDRRMIAVWLPESPGQSQRTIRLETTLTQDRTSLPRVRLINVELKRDGEALQQFVELPLRSSDTNSPTNYTWSHTGLTSVALDGDVASDFSRFRVSQSNYQAQLEEQKSGTQPEVTLLNTTHSWREAGDYVAMSEFDLSPAQQVELLIAAPHESEVIQVFCNENLTTFAPAEKKEAKGPMYKFQLSSAPWPQRVRVIYRGPSPKQRSDRRTSFGAPSLLFADASGERQPISVVKEIWSVIGPASYGPAIARSNQDHSISEGEADKARIKSFVKLWAQAQVSFRERPRMEKAASLASWAGYLSDAIRRRPVGLPEDDDWQDLEDLINRYSDEFGVVQQSDRLAALQLWNESQWSDGKQARYQSAPPVGNELPALLLSYPDGPAGSWPRYLIALGLIGVGIAFPRWTAGVSLAERVLEYPHAICAAIGMAWWLFLAPSWIGALIVGSVLAMWVWNRFQMFRRSVQR